MAQSVNPILARVGKFRPWLNVVSPPLSTHRDAEYIKFYFYGRSFDSLVEDLNYRHFLAEGFEPIFSTTALSSITKHTLKASLYLYSPTAIEFFRLFIKFQCLGDRPRRRNEPIPQYITFSNFSDLEEVEMSWVPTNPKPLTRAIWAQKSFTLLFTNLALPFLIFYRNFFKVISPDGFNFNHFFLHLNFIKFWNLHAEVIAQYLSQGLRARFPLSNLTTPLLKTFGQVQRFTIFSAFGFRLKASGRFSRKQMAEQSRYFYRGVRTSSLSKRVDYAFVSVRLKHSTVGVKVWIQI